VPKTNIYVDGFNLYYGASKHALSLARPGCSLISPAAEGSDQPHPVLHGLRQRAADNADAPQRQQVYMRALETIPGLSIHYGHYLSHETRMPLANPRPGGARTVAVVKTEEKALMSTLPRPALDAFQHDCDVAVVISNDSDLKLPIEVAQEQLGIKVASSNPHPAGRRSRALKQRSSSN